jgi:nitronate monooxygenase
MAGNVSAVLRTPLTDLLGIRLPLVQAPMAGGWTTPELVAAVSNAGGLGMLAGSRLTLAQVDQQIRRTQELTTRPFGVNFLIAPSEPPVGVTPALSGVFETARAALGLARPASRSSGAAPTPIPAAVDAAPAFDEAIDAVLARGVRVVSLALGDPAPYIERVQRAGALMFAMVTTVDDAKRVEAAGVDVIVTQGSEAGGHRSTIDLPSDGEAPLIGTMALVPQVVDAVRRPVVASGGIMDGRGVLAALVLGAAGAQLGTRFLLAAESNLFPSYRERLLTATETDTTVTRAFTGRPARSIRNRFIDEFERAGAKALPWPHQRAAGAEIFAAATAQNNAEWTPLLAGQGLRMARDVAPASTIIATIEREIGTALDRLRGHRADRERSI